MRKFLVFSVTIDFMNYTLTPLQPLAKMIVAEASTYAITGIICGSVLGIVCNKILFNELITYKWGDEWSVPLVELGIIIVVVAIAVILQ